MLDDVFIKRIADETMSKYEAFHGKKGMAKKTVIETVIYYGGNMDDVRAVMTEGVRRIAPKLLEAEK